MQSNVTNLSDQAVKTEDLYLSDTIKYLVSIKDGIHDRSQIPHRDRVFQRVFDENPGDIQALKAAKAFAAFVREKKIHVDPRDLLAGFTYRYKYDTTLPVLMPDDFDPLYRPPMKNDPQREYDEVLKCHKLSPDSTEAKELAVFLNGLKVWLYKHWFSGHILPGYERLMELGFPGLLKIGKQSIDKMDGVNRDFCRAIMIANEAAIEYIGRYAELAQRMSEDTTDTKQKTNLGRIAESSYHLQKGAPRNFFDAVQLLWYAQELMMVENFPASESIGRFDVFMYPFYKKDLDAGLITYNEASELIDALWIKFSGNLHSYQAVTLSGIDDDGKTVANDLTYICMQSTRKLMFDQPLIDFRYVDNMPEKLWNEVVALIRTGTGFPGIFYDPGSIETVIRAGATAEDARNYAVIGCVELGVPGKDYTPTELVHLNWPKLFELMFNHGQDQMQDYSFPLKEDKELDEIRTFDEFYNWYKSELVHFVELAIRSVDLVEAMIPWSFPTPYLSILMEGCYEKGMDVTGGPTKYNGTGFGICGTATAVDSLAAIKKVVYEDKIVKLSQLRDALNADFAGYEELQHILSNKCPKYGNDDDEADNIMVDLVATFSAAIESHTNPRGGKYRTGLYSVEDHARAGLITAATPDGRKAGTFESNSMASVQGKDINGPTALINSVVKTDLSVATNGMVLDIKFNPAFFENPRHLKAFRALIDTYFHMGGLEVQFSVVSRETLLAAQEDPVKYHNLVVRVSGFSAYFRSLNRETQNDIIARTEYSSI